MADEDNFGDVIETYKARWWTAWVGTKMSKSRFLGYGGRYIRRLPLSQRRILKISSDEVVYEYKDTRKKRIAVARCKPEELVDLLLLHVHRRYRHSMRYFGLMAPNVGADFKIETLSLRPSNRHCRGWNGKPRWSTASKRIRSCRKQVRWWCLFVKYLPLRKMPSTWKKNPFAFRIRFRLNVKVWFS